MKRKAKYRLMVTRRERLYVHDEFDHALMLVEMEGEPIEYEVGVAGDFVSRRSVTFHDTVRGCGSVMGYAITSFREGAICSRFDGMRNGETKVTTGQWKIYKGTGKLEGISGGGTFTVKTGEKEREAVMELEGDYEFSG